jgi:hypothetical protein
MADLLYRPARLQWPRSASCWPPSLGVVHDMEAPEGPLTAENCALFFAKPTATGSAHICADENSRVRCVQDDHMAAGARGFPYRGRTVNDWALHVEHAGYARQSRAEWLDRSSFATMEQGAISFGEWCDAYTIPPYHLTDEQIVAGMHGLVGHADVSRALNVGGGHTDPGSGFPWDIYLDMVRSNMASEAWTPEEKARLLAGADAAVAMEKRWDTSARTKVDNIWTQTVDATVDNPSTLGGRVAALWKKATT